MEDLIEGIFLLGTSKQEVPGPVNLGNPHELWVREIADLVVEMTASRSPVCYPPLPQDEPMQRRADTSRAKELLDCEAEVT